MLAKHGGLLVQRTAVGKSGLGSSLLIGGFPVPRDKTHPHIKLPPCLHRVRVALTPCCWLKLQEMQLHRSKCDYPVISMSTRVTQVLAVYSSLSLHALGWTIFHHFSVTEMERYITLQGLQYDPCHLGAIHTNKGSADLSTFSQLYAVTSTGTVCAPVSHNTTEEELRVVFK